MLGLCFKYFVRGPLHVAEHRSSHGGPYCVDRLDAIEEEVLQQVAGRLPSELRVLDLVQQLPSR